MEERNIKDELVLAYVGVVFERQDNENGLFKNIFIAKKERDVFPDWWIMDGEKQKGKSAIECAQILSQEKFGIDIEKLRKHKLPHVWNITKESTNGKTYSRSMEVIVVDIENEDNIIKLNQAVDNGTPRYNDSKWIFPGEIVNDNSYYKELREIAFLIQYTGRSRHFIKEISTKAFEYLKVNTFKEMYDLTEDIKTNPEIKQRLKDFVNHYPYPILDFISLAILEDEDLIRLP